MNEHVKTLLAEVKDALNKYGKATGYDVNYCILALQNRRWQASFENPQFDATRLKFDYDLGLNDFIEVEFNTADLYTHINPKFGSG